MLFAPGGNAEVTNVACPAPFSAAVPSNALDAHAGVAHSEKVTVPVGPEAGATCAVNVTAWPNSDGFGDELNVSAVGAGLTTCVIVVDELALKLVASVGVNVAKTAEEPTANDDVVNVAWPLAFTAP